MQPEAAQLQLPHSRIVMLWLKLALPVISIRKDAAHVQDLSTTCEALTVLCW